MSQLNKDELEAPVWLDQSFFEDVMRTYHRDASVAVKDFQITPGTAAGDHFASIMFKITVNYVKSNSDETIKLIMKLMPQVDGFKKDMLKESPAFSNEIRMYQEILPKMEKVLSEAGIPITFGPPLVYADADKYPSPVIVFKDVSILGFSSPMWGALPFDKTKIAILTIAKFHAASIYLNENGTNLTDFDKHFFKTDPNAPFNPIEQFFKPSILNLIQNMKKWEELEYLAVKLEEKIDDYLQGMQDFYHSAATSTGYCVLNHGDFHAKNLMYRNDGTTQSDFYLIDYQFPIWLSPAHDVYYLLNAVADTDTRENRRDDMIVLYHTEFVDVLRKLGYKGKIPTLLELRIEMLRFSIMDFIQTVGMVGMQFVDITKVDFNEFMDDPQKAMATMSAMIYESEEYRKYLDKHLKRLEAQGTLD